MTHIPTRLDVITDLRRSIMASFSKKGFKDENARTFLKNAEKNLKEINLDKKIYLETTERLNKAKNTNQTLDKRREDVLMASSLI